MNFKSFLALSGLKQIHKITLKNIVFRESLYGISTRITNSQFNLIKDDYIKSVAEATNWPAHYIRAEWLDEDTILVTYVIVDETTREQLQSTLDGDTHHQTLKDKIDQNKITSLDVTRVEDSEHHDIPGKPYVMIRDTDSNVNIKITITSI